MWPLIYAKTHFESVSYLRSYSDLGVLLLKKEMSSSHFFYHKLLKKVDSEVLYSLLYCSRDEFTRHSKELNWTLRNTYLYKVCH